MDYLGLWIMYEWTPWLPMGLTLARLPGLPAILSLRISLTYKSHAHAVLYLGISHKLETIPFSPSPQPAHRSCPVLSSILSGTDNTDNLYGHFVQNSKYTKILQLKLLGQFWKLCGCFQIWPNRTMADKAEANKAKNAGNVNFKNGKYEEALKSYDLAVKLDPEEVFINNAKSSLRHHAPLDATPCFISVTSGWIWGTPLVWPNQFGKIPL